ncbi:hypothetical protein Q7C36_017558 [Tachysurus vachellii]|uniref:Ig-like domain-containing protein n=1 Tax=Tachysurus vachellii TaxID=175792 RepID=A0AA88S7T6_TACVA|nr:hypothetical protein Q7C36_017558 [Tachysurus vachellii]
MRIQVIFGVLLIYTHVVMGSLFQDHVVCRFNQIKPCYVAVGQRLQLQMPWEDGFDLLKTDTLILRYRKTQSSPPTTDCPRWQFANDSKTMILTSAERCDSGTYTLNIVDGDEKSKGSSTFQVTIEAQVFSVKLFYSCLFSGVKKVNCSADGDNLQFSWTFTSASYTWLEDDNKTLVLYGKSNDIVTCHVKNDISHDQNSIKLSMCIDFRIVVMLVTVVICIPTVLTVLYVLTAHQRDRTRKFCNPEQGLKEAVCG